MTAPDDVLLERAARAVAESRQLLVQLRRRVDDLTDIAIQRQAVAHAAQDWVRGAEQRVVEAGDISVRSGGLITADDIKPRQLPEKGTTP